MNGFKKFLVVAATLAILAALFFIGMTVIIIVIALVPILYLYNKFKGKAPVQPTPEQPKPQDPAVIEGSFEVIEDEKK